MGHSKYLDSLSKQEYIDLTKKLWNIQNKVCFICERPIDLEIQPTNIDHIKPLANGGKDDISNFAVTHEHCNKSKKDADLTVARTILRLENIINDAESRGESASLQHVLKTHDGAKFEFKYRIEDNKIIYSFDDIGETTLLESTVFTDKLSNEKTAYIEVPLEYLYHDTDLNPRGLNSSVNLLIKEFYKPNPQLQIALARIDDGKIKLFDGQHKTVAQIMLGIRRIVVRLFIGADYDRLMATNLAAGKQLKQIAFDKSIVRQLHNSLYAVRISRYQNDNNLTEDDFSFSEQQIVDYYKGERGSIKTFIVNSQKNTITRSHDNKLQSYVNFEGKGTDLPLSYSTFEKTFLAVFINSRTILTTPINYKVEEGLNPRILEKEQAIKICNIIAEELLDNKYNDEIGTYRIESNIALGRGNHITDDHLIACRLFKEEIMYNWIKYLQLLIKNHFAYSGAMFDDENLLQQQFPLPLWENIRKFIISLRDLPVWRDRSMSITIFGGKNTYDYWKSIFQTGKTPEGTAVLASPLNVADMIR